jgi:hypothetical protein
MQVSDTVRAAFEAFPNRADEFGIRADIEEHGTGVSYQTESPVRNYCRSNDAHYGIDP